MQRVTVSLDEEVATAFDALSRERGYRSRSEAVRDLVRRAVDDRQLERADAGSCVASLSYVYDHHTRSLSKRVMELQHDHHALVIATTHVHLDHDTCIETAILRGPVDAVRALADTIQAERGVRFAAINVVSMPPAAASAADHAHVEPALRVA